MPLMSVVFSEPGSEKKARCGVNEIKGRLSLMLSVRVKRRGRPRKNTMTEEPLDVLGWICDESPGKQERAKMLLAGARAIFR